MGRFPIFAAPDFGEGPLRFSPLPGTVEEARVVTPLLKKYAGVEPQSYVGKKALKQHVLDLKGPTVAVFSTHGFDYGRRNRGYVRNPLLLSGLALARVDPPSKAKGTSRIVSGLEIATIDLRGTDLVVGSACKTAAGKIQLFQGTSGLRMAFHLAGARSVLGTLWSIPDKETVAVMEGFFRRLADGQDKAAALRGAQVEVIQSRRKANGAAHPYYWAAFVLSGDWKTHRQTNTSPPPPVARKYQSETLEEQTDPIPRLRERLTADSASDASHWTCIREQRWWPNGQLKSKTHEDEAGNLHGIIRHWHENGKLRIEAGYYHGRRYRESRFDADGSLADTYHMKLDRFVPTQADVTRGIGYRVLTCRGGREELFIDLYLPKAKGAKSPLLVWFHGAEEGGDDWASGTLSDCPLVALVGRGYAVASVQYTFADRACMPVQLGDVKAAIVFLQDYAKDLDSVDETRIGLCGEGAGAWLAAMAATTSDMRQLPDAALRDGDDIDKPAIPITVACLIAPAIPLLDHDEKQRGYTPDALFLGGHYSAEDNPSAKLADVVANADKDDPPILFVYGTKQQPQLVERYQDFINAAKNKGVDITTEAFDVDREGLTGKDYRALDDNQTR